MTKKGTELLYELSTAQSDLLTERILRTMESIKRFRKTDIVKACQPMRLDKEPYKSEVVPYAVQTVLDTFVGAGMLIKEDRYYHIAKYGVKVEG